MARFITLLLLIAMALPARAQDTTARKTTLVLKSNLPAILLNSYSLMLERGRPGASWMVTAGYNWNRGGFWRNARQAMRLVVDRRYYIADSRKTNTGFYIGPYVRASAISEETDSYHYAPGKSPQNRFLKLGLGLTFGGQFLFSNGVALDLMAGYGITPFLFGQYDDGSSDRSAEFHDIRFGILLGGVLR